MSRGIEEMRQRVVVAAHGGFCPGVKRAIRLAKEAASRQGWLESLGELVHNARVVDELRREGIIPIKDLSEARGRTVLIRTHGVGPEVFAEAEKRGLTVLDATCPWVRKAQEGAKQLVEEGYQVFIIGKRKHPEVIAIMGWSGGQATVVESPQEAEARPDVDRLGIVCQTTITDYIFQEVVKVLITKAQEVKILNTTCGSTRRSQKEAAQLAQQVDLMLVIGSQKSANTWHLVEVCRRQRARAVLIESAGEVTAELISRCQRVGVTAGASCPQQLIKEVEAKVLELLAHGTQ